ncbi:hypothetical protein AAUPMC_11461, partial [Pasteurella multocida subsp. multocida str. Anand1_cattle]
MLKALLFIVVKMEKRLLTTQFNQVIDNVWQVIYRTLKLSGFNLIITQ